MKRLALRLALIPAPHFLLAAFVLLLAAWVGANAPGNGPDEPANYVKAIGTGTGHPLGSEGRLEEPAFGTGEAIARRVEWIDLNSRVFEIPAGLTPERFNCFNEAFSITSPATCTEQVRQTTSEAAWPSYVGTYPPYLFAVPGVIMSHMPGALAALYAGRFVLGILTALMLAVLVRASWSPGVGSLSLIGPVLAVSPMLLFLGTVIGANGAEVAGATAFFSVILRSARPDPPQWLWAAGAASVALTVLARPTGLLWLAVGIGLATVLHGLRATLQAAVHGRGRRWTAPTVVPVAAAVIWDRLEQPHPALDLALVRDSLSSVPADVRRIATEWIGAFGWASLRMTPWAYRIWGVLLAGLIVAAVLLGRTLRERLLAPASVVVAVLLVALVDLFVFRQTYFPVYGRYTLPLGVLVPLVAGHVVTLRSLEPSPGARGVDGRRRLDRAQLRRVAPRVAFPLAALVQLCGLWTSARRAAVSVDGPAWFIGRSAFAPPGGWAPWLAFAVLGTAALAVSGLREGLRDTSPAAIPQPLTDARQPSSAA